MAVEQSELRERARDGMQDGNPCLQWSRCYESPHSQHFLAGNWEIYDELDVKNRSPQSGIGFRSMEERLRSLGGHLEVHSRLMEGTRIEAWLPFNAARRLAS